MGSMRSAVLLLIVISVAVVSPAVWAENTPPVLQAIPDQVVNERVRLVLELSATDADGDSLTYTVTNPPRGMNQDNTTKSIFTWTPAYFQSGVYTTTFTATDPSGGADLKTVTITVIDMPQNNYPVFDAETAFQSSNGILNTTDALRGKGCFEATVPDKDHSPVLRLTGLASWRCDLSGHDELWFFAKADAAHTGASWQIAASGWPYTGNKVTVVPDGGVLDTTWRLVRIPIAAFQTQDANGVPQYMVSSVETFYFYGPVGAKILIDEIWGVKTDTFDPLHYPFCQAFAVDFGNINLQGAYTTTTMITNKGDITLDVSGLTIEGTNKDEFSLTGGGFTLAPGETRTITITCTPSSFGEKVASCVVHHAATPFGTTTTIPIKAQVYGPIIEVSRSSLDFGTVAAGNSSSWKFTISNTGNADLHIADIENTVSSLSVSPRSCTVAPSQSQKVTVTFTPSGPEEVGGVIVVRSDDPNIVLNTYDIGVMGKGIASAGGEGCNVRADTITSSTVTLAWPIFANVSGIDVFVGPEPSATPEGPLPLQKHMHEVPIPGSSQTYTVTGLAADTDVFVHVEARDAIGTMVWVKNLYVHTVGGPAAFLDTPLREVHLVAPNVLMLVFENKDVVDYIDGVNMYQYDRLQNYTGPQWQAGSWSITRNNGAAIAISHKDGKDRVYRSSVPAGQYHYALGVGAASDLTLVTVDHRIYIVLDEAIGTRDILRIQGPFNTDVIVPYSDLYMVTPTIQVNQVGYSPRATKRYAYVSAWLGDGGPLSCDELPANAEVIAEPDDPFAPRAAFLTGLPVERRPLRHTTGEYGYIDENTGTDNPDRDSGTEVRQIDLAKVPPAEGAVYRIHLPCVGVSWPTQVSETAVFKAFYTVTRGLYHNRWGRDLRSDCTEWSPRPPDHPMVYTTEKPEYDEFHSESTPKTGERPLVGGHHDAGDYDIRPWHFVVSMFLMNAYEADPAAFTDGQLTIPESGNGIPDILDEALWNLAGWAALQEADGGVRLGAESHRHPVAYTFADEDPLPYWTYARHPFQSARLAGLFAQAARLIAPFDDAKAADLTDRARRAYAYAIASGVDENASLLIFFAAGELYRLTGEEQYRIMFENGWDANRVAWKNPGFAITGPSIGGGFDMFCQITETTYGNKGTSAYFITGYAGSAGARSDFAEYIKQNVHWNLSDRKNSANIVARTERAHAFRQYRDHWWGSWANVQDPVPNKNLGAINVGLRLPIAPQDRQDSIDMLSLAADHALGCNPLGMCWITGLGSRHPENPLHMDSLAFMKKYGMPPIPGIPVYGPTSYVHLVSYQTRILNLFYPARVNEDYPYARRYGDVPNLVCNNEFTIWERQAPTAELFGLLIGPGMAPPQSWRPGGKEHRNTLAPRENIVPPGAPQPAFSVSANGGEPPLTVTFIDQSTRGVDSRLWDFGDGTTSTERIATHTYTALGHYDVTLTVTNSHGTNTLRMPERIVVGYTLTIDARRDNVTRGLNKEFYDPTDRETLGAISRCGYLFTGWAGDLTGWKKDNAFTMNSSKTVIAGYARNIIAPAKIYTTGSDGLVINFGPRCGLWSRDGSGNWTPVHDVSPEFMVGAKLGSDSLEDLVVDFGPPYGIWIRHSAGDGGWSWLHPLHAAVIAKAKMDNATRDDLVIDFGGSYGIWVRHSADGTWTQLMNASAKSITPATMDVSGRTSLIVDFGQGNGIWAYDTNGSWTKLVGATADFVVAGDIDGDGRDELTIDFGGTNGIWTYDKDNENSWTLLHTANPIACIAADINGDGIDESVVDFGTNNGIWIYYPGSGWVRLHTASPLTMAKADSDGDGKDELIIDFGGGNGIWRYDPDDPWQWMLVQGLG